MDQPAGVDILLVEDNPDHAEFTRKTLAADKGVRRVFWVKDGEEALDFLHHRNQWSNPASAPRPGLILLDIHLPKLNGHEVLRVVKSDAAFRSIPVVMLTTSDRKEEIDATYSVGANSFVTKPVDFREFVEHIRLLKRYWTLASQLPASEHAQGRAPKETAEPHVLVIQENADSRAMMQKAVEHAGMRATAVASASEALAIAESTALDLVITDVSLTRGEHDGVWLLNRLLERSPDLPIVAVASHEDRPHELVEMGFAGVVFKPVAAVKDLVAIARGVMRR
ncbi:MAG: response regulator [Candidatus Rokubacteria bacterium]|nr:response regulator [Candidatus Rokubacteria bacterium]